MCLCLFLFLIFCLSLFKTTGICFESTKMGIFYWEKIRKNYFAPSEKYSSYAPAYNMMIFENRAYLNEDVTVLVFAIVRVVAPAS